MRLIHKLGGRSTVKVSLATGDQATARVRWNRTHEQARAALASRSLGLLHLAIEEAEVTDTQLVAALDDLAAGRVERLAPERRRDGVRRLFPELKAYRGRTTKEWSKVWARHTNEHVEVREAGRIVPVAVTVAAGDQHRRAARSGSIPAGRDGLPVLGMDIGHSEAETFWTAFFRKLARRGLRAVKLVISDAHKGLKATATKVLGATAQRCRVHFMRNVLAHAGKNGRQERPASRDAGKHRSDGR